MTEPDRSSRAVILFADIAGSTLLYERYGDALAHQCVTEVLDLIGDNISKHQGRVVDTNGDEVMACFQSPKQALDAACQIQQDFSTRRFLEQQQVLLRIGLHCGAISFADGHPFGDTVNTASHLTRYAHGGQIVSSLETLQQADWQHPYHAIKEAYLKGKAAAITLVDVVWNQSEATSILQHTSVDEQPATAPALWLSYQQRTLTLSPAELPFSLGRAESVDLTINNPAASRHHLHIEFRLGEFVLVDQSTNGTFVITAPGKRLSDGQALYLHHQEWTFAGTGQISLGQPFPQQLDTLAGNPDISPADPCWILDFRV